MINISRLFLIILITGSSLSISSCNSSNKSRFPALLERKKNATSGEEATIIKTTYQKALTAVGKDSTDLKQYLTLASVYISEGRITGDNTYYSNAAVKMLNHVIDNAGSNKDALFQAISLKSVVLLNMHQFKDALGEANKGVAINNYNSGIYGALVDANVELGNYDEAVKDCDKMVSIRPDLRSYSRVSYLRQIFGQNRGAIDAMKMAVEAGLPGAENTEWARTKLADLYLDNGNPDSASLLYRSSLVYRPEYPFALIGLARVEKTRKNYDAAITFARSAIQSLGEASFVSLLADLYELKGDSAKATETRKEVVSLLENVSTDGGIEVQVKHNANRELATAYLNAGNLDMALKYAIEDIKVRPENIDANELMAWIYFRKNDFANARIHADKMLVTKAQNASMLYKAGLIYASAGMRESGDEFMRKAVAINPNIDPMLINFTKPVLASNAK